MEFSILILVVLVAVVCYIARPGRKGAEEVTIAPAPAAQVADSTDLESLTKAELMHLAAANEVHAAKSWNKSRIIAALTAKH